MTFDGFVRLLAVLLLTGLLVSLTACNTTRGACRDFEDGTRELSNLIEESGYYISDTVQDFTY